MKLNIVKIKTYNDIVNEIQALSRSISHFSKRASNLDVCSWHISKTATDAVASFIHNKDKNAIGLIRANAVLALIYEVSTDTGPNELRSKSDLEDLQERCVKWVEGIYGNQNVLLVGRKISEKNSMLKIIVTPIKDRKFNARFFVGGSSERMTEIQNEFWDKCVGEISMS